MRLPILFSTLLSMLLVYTSCYAGSSITPIITKSPELSWRFETGAAIYSAAAIQGQYIYVASTNGKVYGLDHHSGKSLWEFATAGPIYSDVSLGDGALYVQSDDNYVYKIALDTGRLIWKTQVNFDLKYQRDVMFGDNDWDYRSATPLEFGDLVYVGSADHQFYALDKTSGKVKWTVKTDEKIRTTALLTADAVVFATFGGFIHKHNRISGESIWTYDTNQIVSETSTLVIINSKPVLHHGVVYVGSRDTNLYAVDFESGELRWFYPYRDSWIETPAAVFADTLYLGSSFKRAQLAISADKGELIWQSKVAKALSYAELVVNQEAVFVGVLGIDGMQSQGFLSDGGLLKLERKSGKELWRFALPLLQKNSSHGVISTPLMADDLIYFGGLDGSFYALKEKVTLHAIMDFHATRTELKAGQVSQLHWQVIDGVQVTLDGKKVENSGSLEVKPSRSTSYTLNTSGNINDQQNIEVKVLPAEQINLAQFGHASASSIEPGAEQHLAEFAIDSDSSTRWSSEWADPQWLVVDLGAGYPIARVKLWWEGAFASEYQIEISDDGKAWRLLYATIEGDGKIDDITGLNGFGRYLKISSSKRATDYGVSLFEVAVYEKEGN